MHPQLLASLIVTLGWIIGKPMTLLFDPYESVAMFLAGKHFSTIRYRHGTDLFAVVLTVNYVVQDGKSNWLEGLVLMGTIVAKRFSNKDRSF